MRNTSSIPARPVPIRPRLPWALPLLYAPVLQLAVPLDEWVPVVSDAMQTRAPLSLLSFSTVNLRAAGSLERAEAPTVQGKKVFGA